MDELKNFLNRLEPGPVEKTSHLERLLAKVWDDLGDDGGGMAGNKLIRRMKHPEWHPPLLTFVIERHGGTVLGSTRAELQRWAVDLERQIATSSSLETHAPLCPSPDLETLANCYRAPTSQPRAADH